jgi:RNA polymerase sigma factor (sigma-70 family)
MARDVDVIFVARVIVSGRRPDLPSSAVLREDFACSALKSFFSARVLFSLRVSLCQVGDLTYPYRRPVFSRSKVTILNHKALPARPEARLAQSLLARHLHMPPPTSESPRFPAISQTKWFAEEVQPHDQALRGYLRRQYPALDTDDLVQESYLRLLKRHASGQIESTKSYLFTIARNTANRVFRRRRLYSDVPVNELPPSCLLVEGRDAADSANAQLRLQLAIEAIDGLPARCREVVKLVALEGLSYGETADRLQLSEATVRVQMARGVARCMEFIREKGESL